MSNQTSHRDWMDIEHVNQTVEVKYVHNHLKWIKKSFLVGTPDFTKPNLLNGMYSLANTIWP